MTKLRGFTVFLNKHSKLFPVDRQIVASTETLNRGFRLDPSRYSGEGEAMLRHIKQLGIPVKRVGDLDEFVEVYLPNRFTRVYLDHPEYGVPMLGTSSMFMTRLPRDATIRFKDRNRSSPLWIRSGDILISRSGTVGTSVICGESYLNHIASDDCFRLRIHETMRGYVTAFLQSQIGMTLLIRDAHGKVIKHLKDHDITNALIPVIDKSRRERINQFMLDAAHEADKMRKLLDSAEDAIADVLHLEGKPRKKHAWLSDSKVSFLQPSGLLSRSRVDPHFHDPFVVTLRSFLSNKKSKPLGDIAQVWGAPRFKRLRADEGHGTALFSSADIMRVRLIPSTHLSSARNAKAIKQCLVDEGTILVSCSGAFGGILGRSVRVPQYLHRQAVTQHVVRVKVTDPQFDRDYVAGILSSINLGYIIITAFRYGKDVPEIDPDDLKTIPIPQLKSEDQERVARDVREAYKSLDRVNELEETAQRELLQALKWEQGE